MELLRLEPRVNLWFSVSLRVTKGMPDLTAACLLAGDQCLTIPNLLGAYFTDHREYLMYHHIADTEIHSMGIFAPTECASDAHRVGANPALLQLWTSDEERAANDRFWNVSYPFPRPL